MNGLTSDKFIRYIERQLQDIRTNGYEDGWGEGREICDIVALCVQRLQDLGFDPKNAMIRRIGTRYIDKETMSGIIDACASWYEEAFNGGE